jgi:hypothetical protein
MVTVCSRMLLLTLIPVFLIGGAAGALIAGSRGGMNLWRDLWREAGDWRA